mgnify:CR=1 FL=1|tara:strand:- start:205 stop:456 length:252 start_codon:yes stop_codon:yes gene_type:complete
MCFFNPKIETSGAALPPAVKPTPTVKQAPQAKKLDTAADATKKVEFGDTARAASTAKAVGTNELKIPLNQNKKETKTGGLNIA